MDFWSSTCLDLSNLVTLKKRVRTEHSNTDLNSEKQLETTQASPTLRRSKRNKIVLSSSSPINLNAQVEVSEKKKERKTQKINKKKSASKDKLQESDKKKSEDIEKLKQKVVDLQEQVEKLKEEIDQEVGILKNKLLDCERLNRDLSAQLDKAR